MPDPTPPAARPPGAHDDCPVTPLGLTGNHFLLLDFAGIERPLPASVLHSYDGLLDLFGGEAWLREHFPQHVETGDGQTYVVSFKPDKVAQWLTDACRAAGERPARTGGRPDPILGLSFRTPLDDPRSVRNADEDCSFSISRRQFAVLLAALEGARAVSPSSIPPIHLSYWLAGFECGTRL